MPGSGKPVRLSELRAGAIAWFHEARLDAEACELLRALGLTKSSRVRLCQHGEPCIVQVRSTRIGLSKSVARGIYVIPYSSPAA
jgi:Fe2+ transport system protein FeoA